MKTPDLVNPFTQPGNWYRANLHTHTTNSDGQWSPEQVAAHYRKNGYQVLALTDHRRTNDVAALTRKGFLVVNGAEYDVRRIGGTDSHHLVAINIPRRFAPGAAMRNANALIKAVRAAGGEVILAHPYWSRHRYEQYNILKGFAAIEVHNFGCNEIGRADNEAHWSQLLDAGRVVPAVAVDDGHAYPDNACGGWVWLKLPALTSAHVAKALRSGCYYSSTGPRIDDFRVKDGRFILRCSQASAVHLLLHRPFGGAAYHAGSTPMRSLDVQLSPEWEVFRAVVIDAAGRRAWSNPLVLRAHESQQGFLTSMRASWRTPYPACVKVAAGQWKSLDLSGVANRGLRGKDAWIGDGSELTHLRPGAHRIHGVPFRILDQSRNRGKAAIALKSRILAASGGKPLPREVRIPVKCCCRAVYLLHGAGYVVEHAAIAEYAFVYQDGTVETRPVLGFGRPVAGRAGQARQQKQSVVQDWYPAFMQFDNELAHKVIVAERSALQDYRVLYTMQWLNPHPGKALKEIRVRSAPGASAAFMVLAATMRV